MSVTTISAQTATAARILDGSSIRVLLLEAAAQQSEGTQQLLEQCGYRVDRVSTPAEADAKLRGGAFDLLMAEADLLTSRGSAVRRLLKRTHPVPLLLIQSAEAEHRQVMHGIKLGAADILMRPLCQQKLRTVWLHCVRQELKCLSLKDCKRDQAMADAEAKAQDLDSIFAACAAQPWGPSSPIMCTSSDGSPTSSSPRCVLQQGNSLFTDTLDSATFGRKQRGVSPAPADASMRAESPPAPPAPVSTVLPCFGLPLPIPAPVKVAAPAALPVAPTTAASFAGTAKPLLAMAAQPLSMPALAAVLASLPMPPVSKSAVASVGSMLVSPATTLGGGSSNAGTRMPATALSAATPAAATLATAQSASASMSDASRPKRKSAEILRKPSAAAMATASTLRKAASAAATSAATLLSGSSSAALSAAMASTMVFSGLGGLGMSGLGMGMAGMALPSYLQPPLPSGQVWGTPINPQAQAPGICPPALPPPTGAVPAWGLMPWMPTASMSLPGMPSMSLPGMPSMPASLGSLMSMPFLGGGGIGSAASMMMPGLFPSPPLLPSVATDASAPAPLQPSGAAALAAAPVPAKARSVPLPSVAAPPAAPAATLAAVPSPPSAPVQPPPAQPLSMMALMQVAASCDSEENGQGDVATCPRRRSTDAAAAATAAYGAGSSGSTDLGAEHMLCLGLAEEDCDLFDWPEMMADSRQKVPRFGSQLNLPSLEDLMEPDVQEVMAEVMSYSQHQLSLSSSQISSSHHLHHGSSSHPAQAYAHTLTAPSELCTSSAYSADPPSRHHSMHGGTSDGCCNTGGYLPRGNSCHGLMGGADADTNSHSCYLPSVTSYDCLSALGEEDVEAEAVAFVGKADDSDGGVFAISAGHAGSMIDEVDVDAGLDACMSAAAHDDCSLGHDADCVGDLGLSIAGLGGGCGGQLDVEDQPCFLKRVDSCSFDGCGDVDVFTAGAENDIISAGVHGGSGAGVCGFVGRMDSFTGLGLSLKKSDSLLHLLNGVLEVAS